MIRLKNIKTQVYTVEGVASTLNVHKRTVHQWLATGLKRIDDKRPTLIHGLDLKEYLKYRKEQKQIKIKDGEIYCVKCKHGVEPRNIETKKRNEKQATIKGKCPVCGSRIRRFESVSNMDKWTVKIEQKVEQKIQPVETAHHKKSKVKKQTEQIGLLDYLYNPINSNLGGHE